MINNRFLLHIGLLITLIVGFYLIAFEMFVFHLFLFYGFASISYYGIKEKT